MLAKSFLMTFRGKRKLSVKFARRNRGWAAGEARQQLAGTRGGTGGVVRS